MCTEAFIKLPQSLIGQFNLHLWQNIVTRVKPVQYWVTTSEDVTFFIAPCDKTTNVSLVLFHLHDSPMAIGLYAN